jgi:hypothetical protein
LFRVTPHEIQATSGVTLLLLPENVNYPNAYAQAYKKAEEMTTRLEAAYALLSAVLVPDDQPDDPRSS